MGMGCQRNGYWAATNPLSGRGLVQPIKLSSAAGRCAGRDRALIRQLAKIFILCHAHWWLMNNSSGWHTAPRWLCNVLVFATLINIKQKYYTIYHWHIDVACMQLYVDLFVYSCFALSREVLPNLRSGHLRFCCFWLKWKQLTTTCEFELLTNSKFQIPEMFTRTFTDVARQTPQLWYTGTSHSTVVVARACDWHTLLKYWIFIKG